MQRPTATTADNCDRHGDSERFKKDRNNKCYGLGLLINSNKAKVFISVSNKTTPMMG